MAKLSENQEAALTALKAVTTAGVTWADKAAWKKQAPTGVSVNTSSLLKTGSVETITVAIAGRHVEVFKPV